MFELHIEFPNHEYALRWLDDRNLEGEKLRQVVQNTALTAESYLKEILHGTGLKQPTGATAASVETWPRTHSQTLVSFAVGSRTRGHILRWLDLGRGWVYPKTRQALWIKKGRVTPPIFRAWARPSPPLHVMYRAASQALAELNENVRKVMS